MQTYIQKGTQVSGPIPAAASSSFAAVINVLTSFVSCFTSYTSEHRRKHQR